MAFKIKPREEAGKFIKYLKDEHARLLASGNDSAAKQYAERLFGIELLCIHCNWGDLARSLENWRERRYEQEDLDGL